VSSRIIVLLPFAAALALVTSAIVPTVSSADDAETRARVEDMYADYKARSFSEIPDVEIDAARALADSLDATPSPDDDVVWLDVRDHRERRISILPGALDLETYEDRRDELEGRPVVVYCTIGYRSGLAARELRRRGVEAHNLAGGILAWAHADGHVVDGRTGGDTHRVHVYGWRWNLLPDGWTGVW